MRIAVVNETSAADKNPELVSALEGRGHEILNLGMKERGAQPELLYIHTGLMSALLLNLDRVDFVVGGCGTGQGYLNAAMQYPGVFCGHILTALDAWLFAQINGGNCVSLALNQGYGWAADVNLRFIFDRLFDVEWGAGYPPHRQAPQRAARETLKTLSGVTHRTMAEIVRDLPSDVIEPVLGYPGMAHWLRSESREHDELGRALAERRA